MTRLLFVHLAKAGGISFRRILRSHPKTHTFDCFHNGYRLAFDKGALQSRDRWSDVPLQHYGAAVMVMRHPLSRLRSCYYYFLAGGLNHRGKGIFPADTAVQQFLLDCAPSFDDCCRQLPLIAERVPHFQPACYWLDQLPNPLADLVCVARLERFGLDLEKFFSLMGVSFDHDMLEHRNKSSANLSSTNDGLDAESYRLVEAFYQCDYRRFAYPSNQLV